MSNHNQSHDCPESRPIALDEFRSLARQCGVPKGDPPPMPSPPARVVIYPYTDGVQRQIAPGQEVSIVNESGRDAVVRVEFPSGGDDRMSAEVERLRRAIRDHRDQKGDDRCWLDDLELYKVLGDGGDADQALPPKCEFLASCERYWRQRQPHIGPPAAGRTIAQLEAEVERLRAENAQLRAGIDAAGDARWECLLSQPLPDAIVELRDRAVDEHRAGLAEPMGLDEEDTDR